MINVKRLAICRALNTIYKEKPILLPYPQEELIELIFDQKKDENGSIYYEFNSTIYSIISKIDFSNVPFDNVKLAGYDLSRSYGIKFNPQTIYDKDLRGTFLCTQVEVIGNNEQNQKDLFEGVKIEGTKFKDCQNVIINPQTVFFKNFAHTALQGVDFSGFSFDGADVYLASFAGSKGAKINPNTVKHIERANSLKDVELTDIVENHYMNTIFSTANNYNSLNEAIEEYSKQFIELVCNQLPKEKSNLEPQIESTAENTKRKLFGISKTNQRTHRDIDN